MRHGRRTWRRCGRAIGAALAAGAAFQVSSCVVNDDGQISGFVDPTSAIDIHNQLFEASLIGQWVEHVKDHKGS